MKLRGFRAVADALQEEEFPLDTHGVDYAVGDSEVEDGQGGFILVRQLTEKIGEREFHNVHAVIEALHAVARGAQAA